MRKLLLGAVCWWAALATMVMGTSSDVVSWGLTYHKNETTPGVSAVGAELLKKYDGMYVGDTSQKQVYLTFDLGYEAGYTADVLDLLKENQIKGLFFLCGNYLKQTELIARMQNEGHQIGNHTNKHRDLPTLNEAEIRKDITDLHLPTSAKFFRSPEGRFDEKTLRVAHDMGLRAVLWSIAIVDWQKTPKLNVNACTNKVLERVHPGAIMLFHITNPGTPEMLRNLIPALRARDYSFGELV
ncbi:MAG: polysaccharide deacetylase family protein [Clostridia bacterium]|nr:polysaccharide deacetylase family protein [Clostridia bacterium]